MIDLQKFCGEECLQIDKPFSRGSYTYATNGYLIVRVPRIAEIEENLTIYPEVEGNFANAPEPEEWVTPIMDSLTPMTCPDCRGIGKTSKCPECNGDGEVYFKNAFSSYTVSCDTCNGNGVIKAKTGADMICGNCGGKGKVWPDKEVVVGRLTYTASILQLIVDLPGIRLEDKEPMPYRAVKFTFDGGDGLIMPLRVYT